LVDFSGPKKAFLGTFSSSNLVEGVLTVKDYFSGHFLTTVLGKEGQVHRLKAPFGPFCIVTLNATRTQTKNCLYKNNHFGRGSVVKKILKDEPTSSCQTYSYQD
jgi:hypothetical protein